MDKIMSVEERIRRAEEVAERRKNKKMDLDYNKIKIEKSKSKTKSFFIQIFICLLIYCGFYYIKNMPVNQNNNWLEKTKEVLSYDVDFMGIYNKFFNKNNSLIQNNTDENIVVEEENNENKIDNLNENTSENFEENLGIGGELTEENGEQENTIEEIKKQDDEDVKYIKENINLIKPANGVITSRFGERESSEIVSANHKGIDIGAASGTEIKSACDGKVIQVSSSGDFGKHIMIQNHDIIFIYAHCSKLIVNEGDEIKQGQKIAEVGSTGRATGPHLHFEIRRGERSIDPELIMKIE